VVVVEVGLNEFEDGRIDSFILVFHCSSFIDGPVILLFDELAVPFHAAEPVYGRRLELLLNVGLLRRKCAAPFPYIDTGLIVFF